MPIKTMKFYYILLRDEVVLSKKKYSSWREIQDEYSDTYLSSLGPWSAEELLSYFADDFKEESNWPFSKAELEKFVESEELEIKSLN